MSAKESTNEIARSRQRYGEEFPLQPRFGSSGMCRASETAEVAEKR